MDDKRCLIKMNFFFINIVLYCFISYIDFKLVTNKIEMEKSVKNKTTTNQT